jgi:hypothetical protein
VGIHNEPEMRILEDLAPASDGGEQRYFDAPDRAGENGAEAPATMNAKSLISGGEASRRYRERQSTANRVDE